VTDVTGVAIRVPGPREGDTDSHDSVRTVSE